MTNDPSRRFTPEETALILRRATELEARPTSEVGGGLTLEELVAAAREAGIDPVAVRHAAAIQAAPTSDLQSWVLGTPAEPELRARFAGRLPTTSRVAFQDAVERAIGRQGTVADVKGTLVWYEDHGLGRTSVRLQEEGSTTLAIARADRRGHLLVLVLALATALALVLVPLGGFAGIAARIDAFVAVIAPVGVLAMAIRALWPALQRPTARRLERALLAVGTLVAEVGPSRLQTGGDRKGQPG